jgi:hypothetical protein
MSKKKENQDNQALVYAWLSDFEPEKVKEQVLEANIEYLEKTMARLEGLMVKCHGDSQTASTARARAIARDTEKSVAGLINGIKYGISFLLHGKEVNLNENDISQREEL